MSSAAVVLAVPPGVGAMGARAFAPAAATSAAAAAAATTINVLVIDDNMAPSLGSSRSYASRLRPEDGVNLFVASGAVAEEDKAGSVEYAELKEIYTDAALEIWASHIHTKYGLHQIYCKSEDLMLRAAHMRDAFGIKQGLTVRQATSFRDKVVMKEEAVRGGMPCPPFRRVHSPMCVLSFLKDHGLPLVMKPVFGSASLGVSIVKDQQQLMEYLRGSLLKGVSDEGGQLEYTSSVMVEAFEPGEMYHVNGYARSSSSSSSGGGRPGDVGGERERGGGGGVAGADLEQEVEVEMVYTWPFQYISTNLEFTHGKSYGSILISERDPRHVQLMAAARCLLLALGPLPQHLVYHMELFRLKEPRNGIHFSLCEVAARRPGGSILGLIDRMEGGHFQEMDFRCQLGLPLAHQRPQQEQQQQQGPGPLPSPPPPSAPGPAPAPPPGGIIGDIVISRPMGRLVSIPSAEDCPSSLTHSGLGEGQYSSELQLQYRPLAKPGSVYKGFDSSEMNSAAQFVAWAAAGQEQQLEALLLRAQDWFLSSLEVLAPEPAEPAGREPGPVPEPGPQLAPELGAGTG